MAVTADFDPYRESGRATGDGLVLDVDRSRAFKAARRHSRLVRGLRLLLPTAVAGTVGLYGVTIAYRASLEDVLPALPVPQILPANLTMHNPRYDGYNSDGGSYAVMAKTAVQPLAKPNILELNEITGEMFDAAKMRTDLTAVRGTYDNKSGQLELFEAINIASATGMKAKLTRASVQTKEGLITSNEPVAVTMPAGSIRAKSMTIRQKLKEATFVNAVVARLEPPKPIRPAAQSAWAPVQPAEADEAKSRRLVGSSEGPIDIVANRLDVSDAKKTALFTGAVKAVQQDSVLVTPELLVTYEGDAAPGGAAAAGSTDPAASKLKRLDAKGPVVITRGSDERVTSASLAYDAANQTAVLDGKVVMIAKDERQLTGDRVEIDEGRDTILVTGNVNAVQGRNLLAGGRLFVDNRAGTTQLTTTPGSSGANDRIRARFYQNEAGKPKRQAPVEEDEAGRFKTDPNAPVDIIADRLDVDDHAKSAVFRGDVQASQGELRIRTSELQATYSGAAGAANVTPSGGAKPAEAAKLSRIQARHKVVVTSADQSATGDWADFNVKTNKAVVGGDVILTKGPNIIRGTRLVIDMTTGQSVLQNEATASSGSTSMNDDDDNAVAGTIKRKRPSAVFFPKSMEQKGKAKAPKAAIDGWSATEGGGNPRN